MATCPDGHQSVATDYCDECGLSIGAPAPIPAGGGGSAPSGAGSTSVYGAAGEPCPNCLLPRQAGDTFCEGCGFDFANEQPAPTLTAPTLNPGSAGGHPGTGTGVGTGFGTVSGPGSGSGFGSGSGSGAGSGPGSGSAPGSGPGTGYPSGSTGGSDPMADLEAELRRAEEAARASSQSSASSTSVSGGTSVSASSNPNAVDPLASTIAAAPGAGSSAPAANGTDTGWVAIASADRAYYDAVVAEGEIDPTAYPFPAYCPDRHYPLAGDAVRIGRSGKRGNVEIDLSGPPTDPGVSHLHAVLQQRPDGGWSVVDLESMNGTVLNDDTAPIPPNQAFPVEAGFRIHVGVWTTLTLIQAS
ncbi:hypothetical protein GCM10009839_81360 [Catenulispora yoronensis]|uniref:FHA domain-containing protein n=2 Tax=Catenulispora yoronensis TaxID=450799 RepID=A0ABP5GW42_9ACTN